jgi:spoIIIJ-associated protein
MTKRVVVKEAATVDEAIAAGLEELGVGRDEASYEVEAEPGKGFLGMGAGRVARVRIWTGEDEVADDDTVDEAAESDGVPAEPVAAGVTPSGEGDEVSDEDLDRIADTGVEVVRQILSAFELDATIDEYEGDDGEIILDVVGDEGLAILIGRHGKTLDAFQTLVTAVANRKLGMRYPILVDVEGYRSRRKAKLEEIARSSAEKAVRSGREVRMRPMSSYERKIVHVALRGDGRVETGSEGEDPYRFVVVTPR